MRIIIKDEKTGKEYAIVGHKYDWELFKRSKGKTVDGEKVGEGNWTSCHNYPNTLEYAVSKVISWLIADEDDNEEIKTTVNKFSSDIKKIIKKRTQQIVAEVSND